MVAMGKKKHFIALQACSCSVACYFAYTSWIDREATDSAGAFGWSIHELLAAALWLSILNLVLQSYRAVRIVVKICCGVAGVVTGAHLIVAAKHVVGEAAKRIKTFVSGGGTGGESHSCAHRIRWVVYALEEVPLCVVYVLLWQSSESGGSGGGNLLLGKYGIGCIALGAAVLLTAWKVRSLLLPSLQLPSNPLTTFAPSLPRARRRSCTSASPPWPSSW
jgi:hypothetical protein